jgi:hypothetical protein
MSVPLIRRYCDPKRVLRLAGIASLLAFGLPLTAGAAPRQQLSAGHVPTAVARLTPAGTLPGSQRLNLAISLPLRNPEELDTLLQQLSDPASPNYRRYLTPEQFTARFGPTEKDYQAVMDFAKSNGLMVTFTHPNRLVLDVSGAATDIGRTFHLNLRVYRHPTEARTFYAPDVEPSVDFALPLLHISGLDNYSIPHPNFKVRPAGVTANATPNSGTGLGGTYRGSDFRAAYVPGSPLTGAGQSVGLLQFDGFYASDIATYVSQAGLTTIPVTVVPVDGGVGTPGSGNGEVCLDIEMVMSMAPGLSGIYVYEAPNPSPWVDLLSRMANDNLSKQLSCSWGGGSPDAASETIFKQMAAQGQSFFNATGDSDAFAGTIDFPSDSTNITQVGGTTLTTGTGASYLSETVWNWGGSQGSSGGISPYYAIPPYQLGISMSANQGSTTRRNVPDVALTADNVYVVYNNGNSATFGGTSCAAPLWAGFTALINQQAAAAGQTAVGFLNPALYAIGRSANYTTAFHDITTGNNFNSSSPSLFSAVAGYDLCTGWGTPNGTNLINALTGPPILAPLIVSNSFALVVEACPNGAIDPAETVTVNFGLKNIGTASTTNLIATLLSTGGILSPSGPQTYGVLNLNGTTVIPFTFTATGSCGGTSTATLQLQDGAADLGTVTFSFGLGQTSVATVFSESFDGVTAPALPAGWTTSASGSQSAWFSSTSARDTTPNALFSRDASRTGVNEVDSPAFTLPASAAQLTFRNNYSLETGYDGGVLEIAIGGGAWTDILAAGGSFVSGGYNYTLSSAYGNPLGGRHAWSGNSGGFITTLINLPASASGQSVRLRWRCGSDSSVKGNGWYVDTVSVTSTIIACCTATNTAPTITAQPADQTVIPGTNVTFQVAATGPAPLSYQWLFNGISLPDATNAALTLTNVQVADAGTYTVAVSNAFGSVLSSNAVLTVLDPWIISQPKNQSVTAGAPATFAVIAVGALPLSYQWLKEGVALVDGMNLSGALTATLTVAQVRVGDVGNYSVVVSNLNGLVVSSNATLVASFPSSVSAQPASQVVLAGSVVSFTAEVDGSSPMSFQWQRDGTNLVDGGKLSGTGTASLTVSNVQAAETGAYALVVSNIHGSVTSSNALLSLWPLVGWGRDDYSQADIPDGLSNVTSIAGGLYHSLLLRTDGTVTAWGAGMTNSGSSPDYGQSVVPAGLSNVVGIASGIFHCLALRADGTVTAWGAGATNSGASPDYGQSAPPDGLSNVVAVAAGYYHSLALRADGTVIGWGFNKYGQIDSPVGLTNAVAIACGAYHSLALKADGTVVAWGAGTSNGAMPQFGQASVPAGLTNVVAVAAGAYHSLALQADGTVVAWGAGTTNAGSNPNYGQAMVPVGLTNIVAIACGLYHSLALQADGAVVIWGAGQINSGTFPDFGQALVPAGPTNVIAIAGGGFHTLVLEGDGLPHLTTQPFSQVATAGATVTLAAMAVGVQPLSYQWQCDGTNVASATTAQLTLPNVQVSSAGAFSVVITNALGTTVSSNAALTVLPAPSPSIAINLAGPGVSVSFTSQLGSSYLLEYKDSLADPAWTPLSSPVAATGGVMVLQDTNAPAGSRYYRLRQQ